MFKFLNKFSFFNKKFGSIVKESGMGGVVWSDKNFITFAKEGYLLNVIVFRCINEIANAVASVKWKVFERRGDDEVEAKNHPFNKILTRPNPEEGWAFFIHKLTAFLVLDGNTFLRRINPLSGQRINIPLELHVFRPDRMKILEKDGMLKGFEHKVNNKITNFFVDPITLQADVLQIKNFNPINDWWGAAATESAGREIDTFNEATLWNKMLLQNQGRPGMLYIFKNVLGKDEYKRFEKQLLERFSNPTNAGRNMIVEGEAEVKPYGFDMNELDFNEGQIKLARRICIGYRVPPSLIGIQDATFNNREEARLAFWEDAIFYYLTLYQTEFNNWIFQNDENVFVKPVLDDVPALAVKREKLWERAEKSTFLRVNEKRQMVGLAPDPAGNVILVPANLIPLGFELPETEKTIKMLMNETEKNLDILLKRENLKLGTSDYE